MKSLMIVALFASAACVCLAEEEKRGIALPPADIIDEAAEIPERSLGFLSYVAGAGGRKRRSVDEDEEQKPRGLSFSPEYYARHPKTARGIALPPADIGSDAEEIPERSLGFLSYVAGAGGRKRRSVDEEEDKPRGLSFSPSYYARHPHIARGIALPPADIGSEAEEIPERSLGFLSYVAGAGGRKRRDTEEVEQAEEEEKPRAFWGMVTHGRKRRSVDDDEEQKPRGLSFSPEYYARHPKTARGIALPPAHLGSEVEEIPERSLGFLSYVAGAGGRKRRSADDDDDDDEEPYVFKNHIFG